MHEEEGSPLLQVLGRANGTTDWLWDGESYPSLDGLIILFEMAFVEDRSEDADA